MKDCMLYLGLDVHKETVSAVVVDGGGEERNLGVFAHRRSSIENLLKKVGRKERIRAVYEAGPKTRTDAMHVIWRGITEVVT